MVADDRDAWGVCGDGCDALGRVEGLWFSRRRMMDWLYYLILAVMLFVGLFLNIVTLPGLWLMVAAHGIYAWVTGWDSLRARRDRACPGAPR